MVIRVTYLLLMLVFLGCVTAEEQTEIQNSNYPQSPIDVKYAKFFSIDTVQGFQRITITDPISSDQLVYLLVPKGMKTDFDGEIVPTPVEDLSIFSASFVGFLSELNSVSSVKYVESINYLYNEEVHKLYESGEIMESGVFEQLDLEMLVLDSPELIILNDVPESNEHINKLKKAGINTLPVLEWQEEHPLARAEWIKVFGALLDKEDVADSLFSVIEQNYLSVKGTCEQSKNKTKAIFSSMYQGVWYVPGGKSYVAHLLGDANGTYRWQESENVGSLALSFEEVILESSQNDVWINPDADSFEELYSIDGRYEEIGSKLVIGAFQANARINVAGGNDYWESGVVRPDLILRDYGKMLYPKQFEDVDFYFFTKLN